MKTILVPILGIILSTAVYGQSAELTVGYQFSHGEAGASGVSESTNVPAGASGNVNFPIARWFGVTGDFGWIQKWINADTATATGRILTYGGGPQFTYRNSKTIQPFVRCVFGAATGTASVSQLGSATTTAFFVAPGGGLDLRLMKYVWIRAGANYFHTDKYGVSVNGIQATAGIQFRLGRSVAEETQEVAQAPKPETTRAQSEPAQPKVVNPPQENRPIERAAPTPASSVGVAQLGVIVSASDAGGAQVIQLLAASVFANSGLHVGDVINSVDGKPIRTPIELMHEISNRKPGDKLRIGYLVHGWWQVETIVVLPLT
jgi:hypothetical protein